VRPRFIGCNESNELSVTHSRTTKKAKKLNKWLYGVAAATALTGVGLLLAPVAIGAGAAIAVRCSVHEFGSEL
jgi:hypothetical protein